MGKDPRNPTRPTQPPDPNHRPPVREISYRQIRILLLLLFFFFEFRVVHKFYDFGQVSTRPIRPFINTTKKKNLTYIIRYTPWSPPHPNHFFSLSTSWCSPDHLSLFSHFCSPPSLFLSLSVTMSLPRRKTKEKSLGQEVAGVRRQRQRHD